jgi:cell division protein FtsW
MRRRKTARRRTGPPVSRPRRPRVAAPARPRRHASTSVGALDGGVVASAALLTALGVVMIYSTTAPLAMESALPPHFVRHLAGLGLGLCVVVGATRTPLALWRRLALPLWTAGVLLLAMTLVFGVEANGARRWLPLPFVGLSLQPAEFAKWTTPVAVAALLADARHTSWRPVQVALLLAALPAGLLLLQPDLGSAALLLALVGVVLFAAALPLRRLAGLAGSALAVGAIYVAMRPYALARWKGFLAPWQTARNEGFQLVQSFVAFGRGGAFGEGLGDGRQKLAYLPEAHTDFILSVVAEELGLVGVLIVLGAFGAFTLAGLRVARRAENPFTQLMAVAMTGFVALPAAVNAAVVMGLLPTTGFTLPFLSFGSNSLVMCALAVGVLLHIAAQEAPPPAQRRRAR